MSQPTPDAPKPDAAVVGVPLRDLNTSRDERDPVNNPGSGLIPGQSEHMANLTGFFVGYDAGAVDVQLWATNDWDTPSKEQSASKSRGARS